MDILILLVAGFIIGTLGTLIGAGGGFILVPILILTHPEYSPEIITAISMAVVAANAVSGTIAYARLGRIDYKAGIVFALFTIPGSIFGVYTTRYIPKDIFHIVFGILLVLLAIYLFVKRQPVASGKPSHPELKRWKERSILDSTGARYNYIYNQTAGMIVSAMIGYLSPLLGIGGGIIHVPFLVRWLRFPIHIATATSHFILAIMAIVSVLIHLINGNYHNGDVLRMVICLSIGAVVGAQLGAILSHRIKGQVIVKVLAICLGIVGLRLLLA